MANRKKMTKVEFKALQKNLLKLNAQLTHNQNYRDEYAKVFNFPNCLTKRNAKLNRQVRDAIMLIMTLEHNTNL